MKINNMFCLLKFIKKAQIKYFFKKVIAAAIDLQVNKKLTSASRFAGASNLQVQKQVCVAQNQSMYE